MRFAIATALLCLTCRSPLAAQEGGNGLEVRPDPENVVANSLIGTWRTDDALNERLGRRTGNKQLEFRDDATVLAKVPAPIAKKLAEHRIFLAGTMVHGNEEHAFLLTSHAGNPAIVWFRERDGDPLGDAELWNVALVHAEARPADLLFVGGDHDNQSFAAYGRATAVVGRLEPAAAITEMIRLLEAGKTREFAETSCAPVDLEEMTKAGRTIERLAKRFEGDRGAELLEALRAISKQEPTMSERGDVASWQTEFGPGTLRLQRIDGRWYMRNR